MPNKFSFNLNLTKAYTDESGNRFLDAQVSDTRLDYHKEHMTLKALESMADKLKNGNLPEGAGERIPVMLLPEHASTFDMGWGVNANIQKSTDGHYELMATFKLHPEGQDQNADRIFKEVSSGTCKKQLSIGGDAVGHSYYSEKQAGMVTSLDDVVFLEHVACTRPRRAAVAATKFIGAMLKSMDSVRPIEKAALTDKERTKNATVQITNGVDQSFMIAGDVLYLFPVPPGDINAAKVAMNEMYQWPLSLVQRKNVHDAAVAVLGDLHDDRYCYLCSVDIDFLMCDQSEREKAGASAITVAKSTEQGEEEMEQKDFDAYKAATDAKIDGLGQTLKEISDKLGAMAPAAVQEPAAVVKAVEGAPAAPAAVVVAEPVETSKMITEAVEKALLPLAQAVAKLALPQGRMVGRVPEGAQVVAKEGTQTLEKTIEEITGASTSPIAEAMTAGREALKSMDQQIADFAAAKGRGVIHTAKEKDDIGRLVEDRTKLRDQLTYAARVGGVGA